MITIEKGIPIPPKKVLTSQHADIIDAFARMSDIESIFLRGCDRKRYIKIHTALSRKKFKFTSRKEENGYRFWKL